MAQMNHINTDDLMATGLTIDAKTGAVRPAKKPGLLKRIAIGATAALALSQTAYADITADAQTAITSAQTDALTVGGYVVAAVAALIVVSLVISMLRKL